MKNKIIIITILASSAYLMGFNENETARIYAKSDHHLGYWQREADRIGRVAQVANRGIYEPLYSHLHEYNRQRLTQREKRNKEAEKLNLINKNKHFMKQREWYLLEKEYLGNRNIHFSENNQKLNPQLFYGADDKSFQSKPNWTESKTDKIHAKIGTTRMATKKLNNKSLKLQTKIQRRKFKPDSRTGSIAGYSQFE